MGSKKQIQASMHIKQPSTGFKNIMHFAKSECPTPKRGVMEERKGQTQARFFSRKNSNTNNLQGGAYPVQVVNSRHNFSPSQ